MRMLHWLAQRPGKLICTSAGTMPDSLGADSFLGHEKGAHSGAYQRHAGYFEQAHLGTLFIDEFADLTPSVQTLLLNVLETGRFCRMMGTEVVEVDVMVIAATNKDIAKEVAEGRFRFDLWTRLGDAVVYVPRLEDRLDDLPELAQHFVSLKCEQLGVPEKVIDEEALAVLATRAYPGNLRDLRSMLNWAVAASGSEERLKAAHPPGRRRLHRGQALRPTHPGADACPPGARPEGGHRGRAGCHGGNRRRGEAPGGEPFIPLPDPR